jgi:uncharacterized membrane protein
MDSNLLLALAFGIGVIAGLRALTAPAVVSWIVHLRGSDLQGSHLGFMGSIVAVAIFTIAALAELVNDKLPKTGSRTAPPSLVIRALTGALAAATLCAAGGGSVAIGALLGAIGSLVGAFGGHAARVGTVKALGVPDFVIALVEDAIAIGGGIFLATRL